MTMGMPEWALEIPSAPVHQEQPNQLVRPFTAQQLMQIGQELLEQFVKRVVLALAGFLIPGIPSFDQLVDWANNLPNQIAAFIEDLNIFAIPADVQAKINEALSYMQDALDGTYTGSDPTLLAVQALAQAWLTATSPLNSGNLFGRIALPQFGSGVPLMALTTAVPNELEPFSATSVPTADGWSWNAAQDAAQVVCDGSTKTLYLQSGVIKVEAGQPLDAGVSVTYSGVASGAGQAIRFVLETFTSDDGSGAATPVTVGSVSSPSGTVTTPVLLGDSSWDIPAGVKSVRPALQVDSVVSAGTVFWKNTPVLKKKLAGPLSGGLPAAIQDRIDDMQDTWNALKGGSGGTVADIPGALADAGQAIRDAIANAMGHSGTGHTSANILTYLQNIPTTVVESPTGGTNIGQDILDTLNNLWDGFKRTTGSTGKTPTDMLTAAGEVADTADSAQTSATSAQSATNTISEIIAIPHTVPSWQGGLADDVSFPIAQIDGTVASTLNKLYLIPVTTQQDRAYTALKFGLTGTSMTNFYVGIYYMDPTTGSISRVLDCGDVKSSLTGSYNQQAITLPATLLASRGDTYFVGLLQVGGTAGSLHRWSNTTNFSTGLYPQFIGEEATGTFSSLPSSVAVGNIIAGSRVWAALGDVTPILAPGSAFYADGFNRANSSQLSTPWTSRYSVSPGRVGVYSNVFGITTGAAPGTNVYTYNSKMATTNHEIQADAAGIPDLSTCGALILRGNTSGCVYLSATLASGDRPSLTIRTSTSYNLGSNLQSGTSRASYTGSSPVSNFTGTLRFSAIGNEYTAYLDGSQVAQWVDSGGVFAYDGTSREVGIGGYSTAGGKKIFDNWQAKDI